MVGGFVFVVLVLSGARSSKHEIAIDMGALENTLAPFSRNGTGSSRTRSTSALRLPSSSPTLAVFRGLGQQPIALGPGP